MINTIDFKNVTQLDWFDARGLYFDDISKRIYSIAASCEKAKKRKMPMSSKSGSHIIFVAGANLSYNTNAETINQVHKVYRQNNISVLFLRGPLTPNEMFAPDSEANKAGGGVICFVPDYTLVSIETIYHQKINTIFVGGGITPERSWKLKNHSLRSRKNQYNKDEAPLYDEDKINELIGSDVKINAVFANYAPSFVEDPMTESVRNWSKTDDKLTADIESLGEWFDNLHTKLRKANKQPQMWVYPSDFDGTNKQLPNTMYVSADMKSHIDLLSIISCFGDAKEAAPRGKYLTMINTLEREDMGAGPIGMPGRQGGRLGINHPALGMRNLEVQAEEDEWHMDGGEEIGEPDTGTNDSVAVLGAADNIFGRAEIGFDEAAPVPQEEDSAFAHIRDGAQERVNATPHVSEILGQNQHIPWDDYFTVEFNPTALGAVTAATTAATTAAYLDSSMFIGNVTHTGNN